jgi:phosphodiesterase/alkaline phosphatase D-like protein
VKSRLLTVLALALLASLALAGEASSATFAAAELLGRPTATSVTLNMVPAVPVQAYVQYGTSAGHYDRRTTTLTRGAGTPFVVTLSGLKANTRYYYRVRYRLSGARSFSARPQHTFVTCRAPGSTFVFAVQSDPHLGDSNTDADLYRVELGNVRADRPDFLVDLGDTFMTEKFNPRTTNPGADYLAHRAFFGLVGASVPLFLANGNHEGEVGWLRDGTAANLAVRSTLARRTYYPSPVPGGFYTGSSTVEPFVGVRDGFYAWTWGGALFVVLDPFWYTSPKPGDGWGWTLGEEQYRWLRSTLDGSDARFKFVFLHHLVGGDGREARGGIEAAGFYEWGGRNADGSWGFDTKRPGWDKPVGQVLADAGVSVVFHGHDHVFVKQDLDGVVYQECPRPNLRKYADADATKYGYVAGVVQPNAGHLRVTVSATAAKVDYVRAYRPGDGPNRAVAYSYTVGGDNEMSARSAPVPFLNLVSGLLAAADTQAVTFTAPEILGRPTASSVAVSAVADATLQTYVQYGTSSQTYGKRTATITRTAGTPIAVTLSGLKSNTRYYYRLRYRRPGAKTFSARPAHTFVTRRAPGSTFVFEVQGDSHPERANKQFNSALYTQMLKDVAADRPDFYLTSGDDFSVDTLKTVTAETVAGRYLLQRPYLSLVGQSAPVFLVNGNHEQAALANLDGTADNVAVWAQTARNRYFPQPAPNGFYSGDASPVPFIGLLRDYYAWTWGDALFVVIDPYWHTAAAVDNPFGGGGKIKDKWMITLGDQQYAWLQQTLSTSTAKYKFVFTHHVLGTGRGGVELAGLYEWGGHGQNGADEFATRRPGWSLPIHQLMAANHVTIFFQGHDHLFAREQLDGVVYQELPSPADPNYAMDNAQAYPRGDVLPSSGRLRVTVSPSKVRVEYVRSYLPADATPEHPDGEVAYAYEVSAP